MTPRIADPGAQLERTALAWQRTSLLIAVNGALLTRAVPGLGPAAVAIGITTMAIAALIWLAAARGYRRGRGRTAAGVLTVHARATRALTAVICVIAILDLTAVLLHD
ncbi:MULTISPECIES: DUF202 domain-containing protein [Thermomonospora]|uniref:Uncharacterized membrane protein YidH (DUF202 family) n=1 Tax=Thermomonospora cellulosilytica TaxID=1411118 RepID=A0A7W3R776_9ACTN|nr:MULTISPECIES: DUF202 domain-containing protein [Thermomonospora]MBA9002326.1 uncharacterized membrane protein YidH (DUF202 family) [Thermomonospora cellulosilytica]